MRSFTLEIPRKDLKYIHDEVIKHMTMLRTQRVKPVKYYQLHIVVRLFYDKVYEGSRSSCPWQLDTIIDAWFRCTNP